MFGEVWVITFNMLGCGESVWEWVDSMGTGIGGRLLLNQSYCGPQMIWIDAMTYVFESRWCR